VTFSDVENPAVMAAANPSREFVGRLAPPPRSLPLTTMLSYFLGGLVQLGCFLLLFSLPFVWAFVLNADTSFISFRGSNIETTSGRVTRIEPTGASENNERVYANRYTFRVNGVVHEGVSYSTGQKVSDGEEVTIQYDARRPEQRSRIAGMRTKEFGALALIVSIFPLIGLTMVLFGVRSGARTVSILRRGVSAFGTLLESHQTNVTVNKQPVWALGFEYLAQDGMRREVSTRTTTPGVLSDEPQELLLYDPAHPDRAVFADELKPLPQLDEAGTILGQPLRAAILLILPALVATPVVWYILRHSS
jgi:hypothetical protein